MIDVSSSIPQSHTDALASANEQFGELVLAATYHSRSGDLLGTIHRRESGDIVPIFRGKGGYQLCFPHRRPLYRLDDFRSDLPVYLVQDEATADAISDSGQGVATTWLGDEEDLKSVD